MNKTQIAAEVWCWTGDTEYVQDAMGAAWKNYYRTGRIVVSCPPEQWSVVKEKSCPVCGEKLTIRVLSGRTAALMYFGVAAAVAVALVALGAIMLPGVEPPAGRVLIIGGLFGLVPAAAVTFLVFLLVELVGTATWLRAVWILREGGREVAAVARFRKHLLKKKRRRQ